MTHSGPFQPLIFCDSVILFITAHALQMVSNRKQDKVPKMYVHLTQTQI